MRILVADQNALLLAAIASTFGRHCVVVTATRRQSCLDHMAQEPFDVVVACEKLSDYTGLELLSEIETLAPRTLCIFAAPAARLARLQSRLDHFRLLGTLSYPIEPRKLLVALKVARTKLPTLAARPKVRHVVLESEWDTGERLGILERQLEVEPAEPPTLSAAAGDADDIPILENIGETSVAPVRWVSKSPAAEVAVRTHPPSAPVPIGAPARPIAAQAHPPAAPVRSFDVMAASLGAPANDPSVEPPPPPPPPPVDTGGAANEPLFDSAKVEKNSAKASSGTSVDDESDTQKPSAGKSGSANSSAKAGTGASNAKNQPATGAKTPAGIKAKNAAADGPRQRKQAVPTAAQREAFQRAKARRSAAQNGFSIEADTHSAPTLQARGGTPGTPGAIRPHWHGTDSLTDLARMATNKRPLSQDSAPSRQRRNLFMGSGVAAVVLASVLAFQLTRSHAPTHHNRQATAQLFSSNTGEAAQNSANELPAQVFGPPPGQMQQVANTAEPTPNLPQPQSFDPNTAPEDPPPPPALEHPGPMEPPAMAHDGPPLGMQGDTDPQ